ncbi:MAG: Gfo/Idh/MocA family oxidoreductase [Ruminococcaceae bacterium]|nr:Gfo/Idh/MocA family oxidoreductase [Oscillospiraceae bacterium]
MMKKLKMGVIGLGGRGRGITKKILMNMPEVEVVALCDEYADRVEEIAAFAEEKFGKRPYTTTDHLQLLSREGIDAVYVATSWETHVEVAIDALKKGIPVALEVGGAYCIERLWDMVRTYEETKTPLMFMENCCFNKEELLVTAMVRDGVLGEIVHCHGAYGHYLAEEIASGVEKRHYRLRNYLTRNCENYPTHELGPIAKILNINRGNQMISLVSMASKAVGMEDFISQNAEKYPHLVGKKFRQGDMVNTLIYCADGSTISLRLDTTLPRSYSREFNIHGTRGIYEMNTHSVCLADQPECFDTSKFYRENFGSADKYADKYLPDVWKYMTEEQKKTGHGGMDGIEFVTFIKHLRENKPMPIDVYDAAAWMCVTALSEASIAAGGMPQAIPDFTGGMWTRRQPLDVIDLKV